MINDDTLIKIIRKNLGHLHDWPDYVRNTGARLEFIKAGFPGIRNDHLSLVQVGTLSPGDRFIYDTSLWGNDLDNPDAPVMLKWSGGDECIVLGIGLGSDIRRDPLREKIRWGCSIPNPPLDKSDYVYRVDVKPTLDGGPGYYYFFRSYRDMRD